MTQTHPGGFKNQFGKNHDVNDDYDEDYFMLDTINASERNESKDDNFMFHSIDNNNCDEDKFSEMDQYIGDYTRWHSLCSGYNLRPCGCQVKV
jgi:hypothetical protein